MHARRHPEATSARAPNRRFAVPVSGRQSARQLRRGAPHDRQRGTDRGRTGIAGVDHHRLRRRAAQATSIARRSAGRSPYGVLLRHQRRHVTIEFDAVEGYQPPQWPDRAGRTSSTSKLIVDDLDQAAETLIAAGAAQPQFQPGGHSSACSPIRPVTRSASSVGPCRARTDRVAVEWLRPQRPSSSAARVGRWAWPQKPADPGEPMSDYMVRALGPDTWTAFAGSRNGTTACSVAAGAPTSTRCTPRRNVDADANRTLKRRLVEEGRAHAALVYDGTRRSRGASTGAPRSCRTSTTASSTRQELDVVPDYRITCIFVDRRYRRKGLSAVALQGALDLISEAGGGVVEGYPHDNAGQEEVRALQRDAHPLRAGRLQLRPQQGHGQLRHAPHRDLRRRVSPEEPRARRSRARRPSRPGRRTRLARVRRWRRRAPTPRTRRARRRRCAAGPPAAPRCARSR